MTYTNASLDILRRVHTAMVSDVCDDLLLENPMLAPAIQQLTGAEGPTVVGPAYPCLVEPTDEYVEIDTLLDHVEEGVDRRLGGRVLGGALGWADERSRRRAWCGRGSDERARP